MTSGAAIDLAREGLFVALKLGAPCMIVSLVVGLIVSLFQALTQIQEQTLTFVPKIIAIFLSLIILMPFMLTTLSTYTELLADHIISGN